MGDFDWAWLNKNQGAVIAVLTFVLAIFNAVFIVVTWKQLLAARDQRLDSMMPVVSIKTDSESVSRERDGFEFDLVLENDGIGPAVHPQIHWTKEYKTSLDISSSTAGIGPQQSVVVHVTHPDFMLDWLGSIPGVHPSVPEDQAPRLSIVPSGTIKVIYRDVYGREYWSQVKVGVYVGDEGSNMNPVVYDLAFGRPE